MEQQTNSVRVIQAASNSASLSSESIANNIDTFQEQTFADDPRARSRSLRLFDHSADVFGPVSYTQMRFLPLRSIVKKPVPGIIEKPVKPDTKDDNEGKFLMGTAKVQPKDDEDTRETIEMQRAERSKFVQELMLATIQSENFRP